jgi:hypothetical protein
VFGIEAVASRVMALYAAVDAARVRVANGQSPDYATGLHCRRCPALSLCPAMTYAAREVALTIPAAATEVTAQVPDILASLTSLSDDEAGRAWVRVQLLEEIVAAMKSSLRARAEVKGLPLPGGEQLVPTEVTRRALVFEKALPVLREKFGAQVEALVERSLSAESAKQSRSPIPNVGTGKSTRSVSQRNTERGATGTERR